MKTPNWLVTTVSIILMGAGGLCMFLGLFSLISSLFTLVANGVTIILLGGMVFGIGFWINLLGEGLKSASKISNGMDDISSVARYLAIREGAVERNVYDTDGSDTHSVRADN